MSDKWKIKPTLINSVSLDVTHIAFLDENGSSDMKNILKCKANAKSIDEGSKFFGLTSVLVEMDDINYLNQSTLNIKKNHWPPAGKHTYSKCEKQVCLHSRDIRMKKLPFSMVKDYDKLLDDITTMIYSLPLSISAAFIDKEKLYDKYKGFSQNPYTISLTFILERLVQRQLKDTDKLVIILESRGRLEDKFLLDSIVSLVTHGTPYVSKKVFEKIKGVYFNPKWKCDNGVYTTYCGLEIADLCAYPIFKYCRSGIKDRAFLTLESKIRGFPNYNGYGLKVFP